jgi:tetratricopeptide (TPR) repeat protein
MKKKLSSPIFLLLALTVPYTAFSTVLAPSSQLPNKIQQPLQLLQDAQPRTPAATNLYKKNRPIVTNINSTTETKKLLETIRKNIMTKLNNQIENNPNNLWAIIQKGWTLNSEGKFDDAIKCFNKALKLQENSATYMGLGMAYIRKGDLKKANAYYMKALSQNESHDPYYIDDTELPTPSLKVKSNDIGIGSAE